MSVGAILGVRMSDMGCFLLPLLMLPLVTEHTWWSAVEESEESEETDDDAFDFASWLEGFQPVQTSRAISYLDENVQPYHRAKIHFYFITRISSVSIIEPVSALFQNYSNLFL